MLVAFKMAAKGVEDTDVSGDGSVEKSVRNRNGVYVA